MKDKIIEILDRHLFTPYDGTITGQEEAAEEIESLFKEQMEQKPEMKIDLRKELLRFWDTCEIDRKTKKKIINEYLTNRNENSTEIQSITYPRQFVEWMLESAAYSDVPAKQYTQKWNVEIETHVWDYFTTAELYKYWKQNIDK